MSDIQFKAITPNLGADVYGVNLGEPLDAATQAIIAKGLLDYRVLFFPEQEMSADDHVRLGRCFGELQLKHPPYLRVLDEDHPEVIVIENDPENSAGFADRADVWHTDVTFHERPPTGSILHMQKIPPTGGDTLWVNLETAYEALSEPMKVYLGSLKAAHDITSTALRMAQEAGVPKKFVFDYIKDIGTAEHPIVRTHPETGRKGLFVNRTFTSHIVGVPADESEAVLRFVYEHCQKPDFAMRRRWAQGDVGIWDNRCTLHYAVNDYGAEPRRIHRVTILGEAPA
jgi:taurine dioxygenase